MADFMIKPENLNFKPLEFLLKFWDSGRLSKFYPLCYFVFSVPLCCFICVAQPAFRSPDEPSHFMRAYQIAHGHFFLLKKKVESSPCKFDVGSKIDMSLCRCYFTIKRFLANKSAKINDNIKKKLLAFHWGGELRYNSTPNTAIYPPFFYFPQALGIGIGQFLDIPVFWTLILSRIINGSVGILLSVLALCWTCRGRAVLFLFLMLPMTLAQFATVGQDALCISIAALSAALFTHIGEDTKRDTIKTLVFLCIMIIFLSASKPPYAVLALFFPVLAISHWKDKNKRYKYLISFCCIFVFVSAWVLFTQLFVAVGFGPKGVVVKEQLIRVLCSPVEWINILYVTCHRYSHYYVNSFIGIIGILDTPLPKLYYPYAVAVIITTLFLSWLKLDCKRIGQRELMIFIFNILILLATVICIYLSMYVMYSPVGDHLIRGVQGRYLIPVAFFLVLVSTNSMKSKVMIRVKTCDIFLQCILLSFALVNTIILTWTVAVKYY